MGAGASTPSAPPAEASAAATCPVDHKTREVWLQQHKASGGAPHPLPTEDETAKTKLQRPLSSDREVSTIPRAFDTSAGSSSAEAPGACPSPYAASHGTPSNAEAETGHDKASGNWIYPSERQFFEALLRKGNTPASTSSASELATSVASIIPIHNAVNERAWKQIVEWESQAPSSDPGSKKCGGPKLYSFRGLGVDPQFLSPRARFNSLLGYQKPFDRHDWVVERCGGERVEYVIDFYQGKSTGEEPGAAGLAANAGPGKLSFYLDVRPKLNTLEGWRLRFKRFTGL
ncbi:cytochrome c1 heme lyase CYT2 [Aspergillus clavatus NRRL 1]|uniref:Holocytochrome c-type synthase n=1 Tax=Aspergillus clavatus (strain ATCC 1007 / CBS 513.65 / DSM 816 / NCTC 3887 / NRRL 1 / QM 1276 / 107) TaxID=344612 RepID=A1CH22_ASPCL|nr:cytochrome c1 heme lyase [Aspergillus clavatus NRRL 1]EAW10177.1 cytochrome c1 heme lyase [Aspergillus clavatus NRRL 1]